MRYAAVAVILLAGFVGSHRVARSEGPTSFEKDVKPILASKCTPCHFAGGKMYDRLPFDRPETIVKLGERLFTRIKDEEARAKIRKFLKECAAENTPTGGTHA